MARYLQLFAHHLSPCLVKEYQCFTPCVQLSQRFVSTWRRTIISQMEQSKKKQKKHQKSRDWSVLKSVSNRLRGDILLKPKLLNSLFVTRKLWEGSPMIDQIQLRDYKSQDENKTSLNASSDQDIVKILCEIASYERSHDYMQLVRDIEEELCNRLPNLNANTVLCIADTFYMMNYKASRYMNALLHSVDMRWEDLNFNPHQIIQLLFYIGIYRNMPAQLKGVFEETILRNMGSLTVDEIGLACHSFFVSNTRVDDYKLLHEIGKSTLLNLKELKSYNLANILKVLKHGGYHVLEFYEKLGDKLVQTQMLRNAEVSSLVHVANSFGSARVYHAELFENISNILTQHSFSDTTPRTKDISRIIWSFANMQFPISKKVKDMLVTELHEKPNLRTQYSVSFVESLVGLAVADLLSWDLISYALSDEFLQMKSKQPLEQHFQLQLLDTLASFEENYTGSRLPQWYIDGIPHEKRANLHHELLTRKGLSSMVSLLKNICPSDVTVTCEFLLPHSRIADIEIAPVGNEKTGLPDEKSHWGAEEEVMHTPASHSTNDIQPEASSVISSLLHNKQPLFNERELPLSLYFKPDGNNSTKKSVVKVYSWNQFLQNQSTLLGIHQLEIRLLQKMGYQVLAVTPTMINSMAGMDHSHSEDLVRDNILLPLGIVS